MWVKKPNLSHNFSGISTTAQSKLVLHNEIFLRNCLATLEKTSIASCRRHDAYCNLKLQLAIDSKYFMQSMQKVKPCALQSLHPKIVAKQVAKKACYTLQPTWNFSRNAFTTQVVKKIAPCNTASCRAGFYLLQRLQRFFKTINLQVASLGCNVFFKLLQVVAQRAACSGFLFPTLRDKLQRKLHCVALALGFLVSWPILQSNAELKNFHIWYGTLTCKVFNHNSFDNIQT